MSQSEGYRFGADYLHQSGSYDKYGGSFYRAGAPVPRSASASDDLAVTAALAVELDELPERLRALIHKEQRFCRHRNLGGT